MTEKPTQALGAETVGKCILRMAREIAEHNPECRNLVLIGILRRGVNLAQRLVELLGNGAEQPIPLGILDISSYRDDNKGTPGDPQLLDRNVPFSLDNKRVVLVDDVLYTGRTVRAALDALSDLGRPASIQLAVLVDRGEQQLPIRADYVGKNLKAEAGQRVFVRLRDVDGVDAVMVGEPG